MMFCSEPIQNVRKLMIKDSLRQNWCNCYFQITYSLEYHTTQGFWILLETQTFYITIGYEGVVKYKKPYNFPGDRYEIDDVSDGETLCYQEVIFVGQHIREINECGKSFVVFFDDFKLRVYSYDENEDKWFEGRGFTCGDEIVPVGTHLLKRCSCGGNPRIYLDSVDDFFIRCEECHTSTRAEIYFKRCVDAWNNSNRPITVLTDREYFLQTVNQQKLNRILVSNRYFEDGGDDSCWAEEIILEFENVRISVQSSCYGEAKNVFCFSYDIIDYNREIYSYVISPTTGELKYESTVDVYGTEEMFFELDDTKLSISSTGKELYISLAEIWENNFIEAKRKKLFEHN